MNAREALQAVDALLESAMISLMPRTPAALPTRQQRREAAAEIRAARAVIEQWMMTPRQIRTKRVGEEVARTGLEQSLWP